MKKMLVYFTDEQTHDIRTRARREQRPIAEIIRDLVDVGRHQTQAVRVKPVTGMLARLQKLNLAGPADLSVKHDDYLYGDK